MMLLFNKFFLLAFVAGGVHGDHRAEHTRLCALFVLCG
jgi:hypothetical protein